MSQLRGVDQILADYRTLEPGESDAWNPVTSKFQLGYRLNLFYALAQAMRIAGVRPCDLRVLDVGCGNGRSARAYLDLGLQPGHICGLDVRPGALALARALNPAIDWRLHDGGALPAGHNWISVATVFSSITALDHRQALASDIAASLPSGGHAFYYDARRANPFAGGDMLDPERLFAGLDLVWAERLGRFSAMPLKARLSGVLATGLRGDALRPSLRELAGDAIRPSQQVLLFRKP